MINKLDTLIFGNIPFSCESKYSLEESIVRLQKASKRSVFSSLFKQNAVGKVSASKVRLQRLIPMFGNSFKPIFVGNFREINGKVYLEGKFTTFIFSKIFMTLWFSFALFWTILATIQVFKIFTTNPHRFEVEPILIFFPLIGAAFCIAGVLFIKFCWRLSSGDMNYLKKVILKALTKNS